METMSPPSSRVTALEPKHISLGLFSTLTSEITLCQGAHAQMAAKAPFTQEVLATVPVASDADVDLAVQRARAVQPAWAARSFADRARIFLRFYDLLLERHEEALDLIQLETGKARCHAYEEVLDTAVVSRYYALRAEKLLRPRRRKGAFPLLTKTWEFHSPVGVAGFIVPWNYPLTLAVTDAVPALMAGNTAVLKPDRQTSFTALWAIRLLREAGLPADVFPVVTGEGASIGPALAKRVDFLMFTGSTQTGKTVAGHAAARLIGCSLELGGKNPMIVCADADVDAASHGAIRGCFTAAGQLCVSIERIYVHESIFDAFAARFAGYAQRLKMGAALDYSVDLGSLTSPRQLAKVEEHVQDAVEKGARLLAGGRRRPEFGPLFYDPTILTEVHENMKVYSEETFGPVVSLYRFRTEEEAIERANRTSYGLNASVWSRNSRRAIELAQKIRAGSVNVNEGYVAAWGSVDAPIGGMKESGLSRRHGAEGILKFTEAQTVAVQRVPVVPLRGMTWDAFAKWLIRLLRLLRHTRI